MTEVKSLEDSHAEEWEKDATKYIQKYVLSVQNKVDKGTMIEKLRGKGIKRFCSNSSERDKNLIRQEYKKKKQEQNCKREVQLGVQ